MTKDDDMPCGLASDIARIAALRGKPVDPYLEAQSARPKVPAQLWRVFQANPNSETDLEAFDRLPTKSREYISHHERAINACVWLGFLSNMDGDEEALIEAVDRED